MALTIKQLTDYSWMSQASYLGFFSTEDINLNLIDSAINEDKEFTVHEQKGDRFILAN